MKDGDEQHSIEAVQQSPRAKRIRIVDGPERVLMGRVAPFSIMDEVAPGQTLEITADALRVEHEAAVRAAEALQNRSAGAAGQVLSPAIPIRVEEQRTVQRHSVLYRVRKAIRRALLWLAQAL